MNSAPTGTVFDIKKFSIHDGPGIRTTVFLKGCPLRCWWCHNPESQRPLPQLLLHPQRCISCAACLDACTQGAIGINGSGIETDRTLCLQCGLCAETCFAEARELVGREMTVPEVMAEIERDVSFFDESGGGVTFSGGDPLLQSDFLLALLMSCKEREIHTAVDTSGSFAWSSIDLIRSYVDLFLYDVKVMDDLLHREVTGVSNQLILRNLSALSALGHKIVIRVPIIPGVNDDEQNIRKTAKFAAALPTLEGVSLLPYHAAAGHKYEAIGRDYEMKDVPAPTEEHMDALAETMSGYGLTVKIGG